MAVYNLSFLILLVESDSTTMVVVYSSIAGVLISAIVSSVNVFVVELFPTKCRFSSTAFCYSIGAAVFGGTTPMICTLLIKWFGDVPMYIGIYMFLVTILGVISALMFRGIVICEDERKLEVRK
jgi:MHS family proline/betaine transporter-like MFS transporter